MRIELRYGVCLLLAFSPSLAQGGLADSGDFTVSKQESTLTYHVVHKLHKVDGVSKQIEGKARMSQTGQVQVAVRVPSDSFDSANVNRDAHCKEVIEAARYPVIEVKALCEGVNLPAAFPSTVESRCRAKVSFHGIDQTAEIPVKMTFDSPAKVHATASFALSLDAFKVERPSLMFVKINDELRLDAALVFTR